MLWNFMENLSHLSNHFLELSLQDVANAAERSHQCAAVHGLVGDVNGRNAALPSG